VNWLDAVILLAIAASAFTGLRTGLIRQVVTLISLVVGVIVAGALHDEMAKDVLFFIDNERTARIVGFLVLMGAVYLAGQLVAVMLRSAASLLLLGWADRLGGAAFGAIESLIVIEVLLVLIVTYPQLGLQEDVDNSALSQVFLDAAPAVTWVLPDRFADAVDAFLA
jgi:membrane protein required for colicin V production